MKGITQKRGHPIKLSARNRAKGRVKRAKPGVVTAGVDLEIPAGGVITSVITKRSAETMGL